ncbi:unnamed protein product, partial [Mesorhabditis belari]|uniref:D-lactate dehydratase n=1 Tax=Mesorhabditis belari TaxID=2138241 RepID=A0AAF3J7F5_9BILA
MAEKTALVILADGAEEMEATIAIDVLRRGGIKVTVAGLQSADVVKCARETRILPDHSLSDVKEKTFDAIVLPGGQPGSNSLAASAEVGKLLQSQDQAKRIVAAICAAPLALKSHKIGQGATITSYPGVRGSVESDLHKYSEDSVVVSGNIVTSRGPGTAFLFGLKLVEVLVNAEKAKEVAKAMLVDY